MLCCVLLWPLFGNANLHSSNVSAHRLLCVSAFYLVFFLPLYFLAFFYCLYSECFACFTIVPLYIICSFAFVSFVRLLLVRSFVDTFAFCFQSTFLHLHLFTYFQVFLQLRLFRSFFLFFGNSLLTFIFIVVVARNY